MFGDTGPSIERSVEKLPMADIDSYVKKSEQIGESEQCIKMLSEELKSSKRRLKRAKQQIEAYRTLAHLSSLKLSADAAMEYMVKSAGRLVHAERCSLFTVETMLPTAKSVSELPQQTGKSLELIPETENKENNVTEDKYLLCHISDNHFEGVMVEWGKGVVGSAAQMNRTINIPDAYKDPRFCQDYDKKSGYKTKALLTVPIVSSKKVVGVIQAINRKGEEMAFSEDDVVILETIANNAGAIIREKRVVQNLKIEQKRGKFLMELMNISNEAREYSLSLHKAVDRVRTVIKDMLDAVGVNIYLVDNNTSEPVQLSDERPSCDGRKVTIPSIVAKSGKLYKDAQAKESSDASIREDAKRRDITSVLCMPVSEEHKPLAVVEVVNKVKVDSYKSMSFVLSPERRRSVMHRRSSSVELDIGHKYVPFKQEDEFTLELICTQIRSMLLLYADAGSLGMYLSHNQITRSLLEMHKVSSTTRSLHHQMSSMNLDVDLMSNTIKRGKKINLDSPDFDVFAHSDEQLVAFAIEIFRRCGVTDQQVDTCKNFVVAVRTRYLKNPFHNWKHGFCVFHHSYLILSEVSKKKGWSRNSILYLLVSALSHDVGHPGNTNDFEINSQSERAVRYNHQSVLENHHCSLCFQIMRDPSCNLFKDLEGEKFLRMKNTIINLILATDMKHHFKMQSKMRSMSNEKKAEEVKGGSSGRQQVEMEILIHSADLANQGLVWSISSVWADRVCDEFQAQAESETKLGLPVAPFMRGLEKPTGRAKLQMSFIDAILVPWWDLVRTVMSSKLVEKICENLGKNRKRYSEVKDDKTALSKLKF